MSTTLPPALLELIYSSHRILCVSHVSPDGDAYGSLLGMTWLLRTLGKAAIPAMHDPLQDEFRFLPGAGDILAPRQVRSQYDLLIALDASSIDRLGAVYQPEHHDTVPLAVIDHHITNTCFGNVNWVAPECAATCQMLVYLADALNASLAPPLATCLLTGIITDTLAFRTSNTTPGILEAAMRLQYAGGNLPDIIQRTINRFPISTLRLWALVLPDVQLEEGVIWAAVTQMQLRTAGHANDESKLNTVFATVNEADISAVFTEKIGKNRRPAVECSFRAKPGFNVGDLALAFGGGGHAPASGCTLEGTLPEVMGKVVPALKAARRRQARRGD